MLIKNVKIFDGKRFIKEDRVRVSDGKFCFSPDDADNDTDCEVADGGGGVLSPGFIDLHIHGAGGRDFCDGADDSFGIIADTLKKNGTTAFLATSAAAEVDKMEMFLKKCSEYDCCIGAHIEGTFINPVKKGAINTDYVYSPTVENYNALFGVYKNVIKRVNLAVELDDGYALTKTLTSDGTVVSVGHSNADGAVMSAAVDAGVRLVTHFYNCMDGLNHRNANIVSYTLAHDDIYAEVIADGVHVNDDALILLYKAKGSKMIALISDAVAAAGMSDGIYDLGGLKVTVNGSRAALRDGAIAGSCSFLSDGVVNLKRMGLLTEDILRMATATPAEIVKADGFTGRVKEGHRADFVFLNEDDLSIEAVYIKGNKIR